MIEVGRNRAARQSAYRMRQDNIKRISAILDHAVFVEVRVRGRVGIGGYRVVGRNPINIRETDKPDSEQQISSSELN